MLRPILNFVVRGRVCAAIAATVAAILSVALAVMVVFFPPLFLLGVLAYFASAAVVGLIALKFGLAESLVVMLGPALFWSAPMLFGSDSPDASSALMAVPLVSTVAGILLPVAVMAEVLRTSRSQAVAFGAGAGLLAAVLVLFHVVGFEPMRWLTEEMLPVLARSMPDVDWATMTAAQGSTSEEAGREALATGMYAANSLVILVLGLMVSRWCHAVLDNPGGFGREFRELRFGRGLGYATVVLVAVSSGLGGWFGHLGLKLLPLALVLALFQGLAIAHALAQGRSAGRHWLVGLYVLLLVPLFNTLTLIGVMMAGLLDPWLGFRERWAKA